MRKQILFTVLFVGLGALLFTLSLRSVIGGQVLAYEAESGEKTAVVSPHPIHIDALPSTSAPLPTSTPKPTPLPCNIEFEGYATAGNRYVWVSGDIGVTVELYDLTTSTLLGADVLLDRPAHTCPGFADFTDSAGVGLLDPLVDGHILAAISDDGTHDTTVVLALPPTSTPSPSNVEYLPIIMR